MNFSFVLPTRGEREPVLKMLDAFERTTKDKRGLEVLMAVDEGNTDIINTVMKQRYSFFTHIFERPKTEDFTNDYYNWLANRTIGDNICAFNDDAWMRTNHWDAKILSTIRDYGRNVYMVDLLDTARMKYSNSFPCFPMISRRAFCTMGYLLHPRIPMYPADKVTHDVYFNTSRVIPIRNVLIEHEHMPETDESKKRMMDIFLKQQAKLDVNIYGVPQINIGDDLLRLAKIAQSDGPLRLSKWKRILQIIAE